MDAILTFLLEKSPYAIWLLVGGCAVWLYSRLKNKGEKAKDRADDAHEKMEKLPCKEHGEKIDKLSALPDKVGELPCKKHEEKMDILVALDAKVDGILQTMQTLGGGKKNLIQAYSPINISEYGNTVSEEIELKKYIGENWEYISNMIDQNAKSMNLYDIQQFCFNLVVSEPEKVLSPQGYDAVKSKAYLEGIAAIQILQLTSILIRNKYFEENGLSIDDIDIHDPNKMNPPTPL
jgi:hypothetical protein